jgi:hypothetical protein
MAHALFDERAGREMQRQPSACPRQVAYDCGIPPIEQKARDGWGTCFGWQRMQGAEKGRPQQRTPDEVNPET